MKVGDKVRVVRGIGNFLDGAIGTVISSGKYHAYIHFGHRCNRTFHHSRLELMKSKPSKYPKIWSP